MIGRNTFWQAIKFGIVGVGNTLIDFGLYNLMLIFTSLSVNQSALISGAIALVNSLILNSKLTFKSKISREVSIKFIISTLFGLFVVRNLTLSVLVRAELVNNLIDWIAMITDWHGGITGLVDNINLAIATIALMAWNFVSYKYYVYKK